MKSIFTNEAIDRKVEDKTSIKLKSYDIICQNVEDSISYGWNKAHKHTDTPTEETIKQCMYDAVTNGLSEIINFD